MAKSLNRVTLIGRLGQDPDVRVIPNGAKVATLNIATNESYKDKSTDEWKENTDWHRVVVWDRLAEVAEEYLKKGSQLYVEGKIKTRSYEDSEGVTKYITEIVAQNFIMMSKDGSGGQTGESSTSYSKPKNFDSYGDSNSDEDFDDEVPF